MKDFKQQNRLRGFCSAIFVLCTLSSNAQVNGTDTAGKSILLNNMKQRSNGLSPSDFTWLSDYTINRLKEYLKNKGWKFYEKDRSAGGYTLYTYRYKEDVFTIFSPGDEQQTPYDIGWTTLDTNWASVSAVDLEKNQYSLNNSRVEEHGIVYLYENQAKHKTIFIEAHMKYENAAVKPHVTVSWFSDQFLHQQHSEKKATSVKKQVLIILKAKATTSAVVAFAI